MMNGMQRFCRKCLPVQIIALFGLTFAPPVQACLWDWDTLQMERRRFPGVLEMITGKFVRHSRAYYEWRIADRSRRMRSPAQDPELADDLAVAYSKLGRHGEGITLMEQVLKAHPDRYETLSNVGTIHMLAGDLKTGKAFIDRAIVINPDAHFGREKYQSLLAEYFLNVRRLPHPLAENAMNVRSKFPMNGFAKFVVEKSVNQGHYPDDEEVKAELARAQQGVLGMMYFANYDSPLLLEALGDLLIAWPTRNDDALQLAARAYYRIVQVSDDLPTTSNFTAAARNALVGHLDYIRFRGDEDGSAATVRRDELEKLSSDLNDELADANAYVATIAADEAGWIDQGVNVDEAFSARYYDSLEGTIELATEQLAREPRDVRAHPYQEQMERMLTIAGAVLTAIVAAIWYSIRRRKRASD